MQTISQKSLSDLMYYRTIPVFTYQINYPYFSTTCNIEAAKTINNHYASMAEKKEAYCRNTLYPQAVESAQFIPSNYPPFNTYQFTMTYNVTYNLKCITSLYFEEYTFMGGAHGGTTRTSDTWDFKTGKQLQLKDFFKHNSQFVQNIESWIEYQISRRLIAAPSSYFDDYAKLLRSTFNSQNYYLTPEGIMIYFQQYDIAPYSSGFPEFLIPYNYT